MKEVRTVRGILGLVLLLVCFDATWLILVGILSFSLGWISLNEPRAMEHAHQMSEMIHNHPMVFFVIFLPLVAFCEEVLFRLMPLAFAVQLFGKKMLPVMFVAIIASMFFGSVHSLGLRNILFQGEGGLLYCLLFLKCGGWSRETIKPLAVTTATHYTWDAVFFLLYL